MRSNKHIVALERADAKVRASAATAQTSHVDATILLSSAGEALARMRADLSDPTCGQSAIVRDPKPGTFVPSRLAVLPPSRRPVGAWVASAIAALGFAAFGALMIWPSGGDATAAKQPVQTTVPAKAVATNIDPAPEGLAAAPAAQRPAGKEPAAEATLDDGSRMYGAPFAKTDVINIRCLAEAVYYEARGEPADGQIAVAQVVLNRARSGRWPKSICNVVNQGVERGEKCQFSYVCQTWRTPPSGPAWESAKDIANDAVQGRAWLREMVEATHYHSVGVAPVWRVDLQQISTVGSHIFYRDPESAAALSLENSVAKRELQASAAGETPLPSYREQAPEFSPSVKVPPAVLPKERRERGTEELDEDRPAKPAVQRTKVADDDDHSPKPKAAAPKSAGSASAKPDWARTLEYGR